ncbi:MAG: hypothetical protein K8S55_07815 [Phycisphaerae bacterium]|nr:hypothetical protein [Phycisphaerae bacterium]
MKRTTIFLILFLAGAFSVWGCNKYSKTPSETDASYTDTEEKNETISVSKQTPEKHKITHVPSTSVLTPDIPLRHMLFDIPVPKDHKITLFAQVYHEKKFDKKRSLKIVTMGSSTNSQKVRAGLTWLNPNTICPPELSTNKRRLAFICNGTSASSWFDSNAKEPLVTFATPLINYEIMHNSNLSFVGQLVELGTFEIAKMIPTPQKTSERRSKIFYTISLFCLVEPKTEQEKKTPVSITSYLEKPVKFPGFIRLRGD